MNAQWDGGDTGNREDSGENLGLHWGVVREYEPGAVD